MTIMVYHIILHLQKVKEKIEFISKSLKSGLIKKEYYYGKRD